MIEETQVPGLTITPASVTDTPYEELAASLPGFALFQVQGQNEFDFDPRLLALQAEYAYDPNAWAEDVIGPAWDPDPWQNLALDELVWDHFVALSTATGPGKTAVCSIALLHFLANRPFPKILCTAPTQPQLKRALWPEIAKWMRHSRSLERTFEYTQTRISMRGQHANEWFAEAKTARPQPGQSSVEALQGLHADHVLILVDEASGVPDQVMNAIDGCITTKGTHVLLAGNPVRRRGYFYRTISDERQRRENGGTWHVHFVSATESKHVNIDALQRNIRLYGKESDYYRVKVLGLPPLTDAQGLVSPEEAFDMHMRDPKGLDKGISVIACDPARYGADYSVMYVRKGWTIVDRAEVHGMDGPSVAKIVVDLYEKYWTDYICIDSIGIGASVFDQVKLAVRKYDKGVKLEEVIVGEGAVNDDKFHNLRAELFWMLPRYVRKTAIPFETDRLDEELPQMTYGWNQTDTKIKLVSKDELRKLLGRSPNDADAFALCFYPDVRKEAMRFTAADIEYFSVGSRLAQTKEGPNGESQDQRRGISSTDNDPLDPPGASSDLATFFQTNYARRRTLRESEHGVSGRHSADGGGRLSGLDPMRSTMRRRLGGAFQKQFHS